MRGTLIVFLIVSIGFTGLAQESDTELEEVYVDFDDPEKAKDRGFVITPYATAGGIDCILDVLICIFR